MATAVLVYSSCPERGRSGREIDEVAEYYWCLTHDRVEAGTVCRATNRLGPYGSPEAARAWRDRVEARDDAWSAEDERWHGEDDQDR